MAEHREELAVNADIRGIGPADGFNLVDRVDAVAVAPKFAGYGGYGGRAERACFLTDIGFDDIDLQDVGQDLPPQQTATATPHNHHLRADASKFPQLSKRKAQVQREPFERRSDHVGLGMA